MTFRKSHHAGCATAIRAQMIYAQGSPDPVPVDLATAIALEIVDHCGHIPLKAFRLAYNWTIVQAVKEVHALFARESLGSRGLHERSWKDWEAGKNTGDDYRDLLCRLFHTGPVHLGFASDYTPLVPGNPGLPLLDRVVASADAPGSDMHRRTFVLGTSVLATLGSANDICDLYRSVSPARRSGRVDQARIEDLSIVASAYRRGYQDMPASELLTAAHAHLMLACAIDPALQPETTRKSLLTVIGEMAALVGVIYLLDRGDAANGWQYVDLAWEAARAAENAELQAIILGGRSFGVAYFSGDHQAGFDLASYACDLAQGGASGEARGWVAAVASERAASLGNYSECQRLLVSSREALSWTSDDDPRHDPLAIGVFNLDKLAAYEGGDLVRLGRYQEAEPALDAAINHLHPSMQRHRCTAHIDRAEARLAAEEVDGACQDGMDALDLIARVQHTGNLKRLRSLSNMAMSTGSQAGKHLWRNVMTATADLEGSLS